MNLSLGGDSKTEGCLGGDLVNLRGASLFHLELFGAVHVEVGGLEPDLISHFPRGELGGDSFLHLLLGILVSSLGIVMGSRYVRKLALQIG